jgi:DNA processing protein
MIIYYSGDIDILNRENWVAIIGSRKANQFELQVAYQLAQKCVKQGKIVISGLALGIDAKGHEGALDVQGGQTIGIVNTPQFRPISPASNRGLAQRILNTGGIIYPYNTDTDPNQRYKDKGKDKDPQYIHRLLERDILLAYLCPVIVIVKDSTDPIEGGTRWATNYGFNFHKKVFRYDSNHNFHENPEVIKIEKRELNWKMELQIEQFENIEFKKIS